MGSACVAERTLHLAMNSTSSAPQHAICWQEQTVTLQSGAAVKAAAGNALAEGSAWPPAAAEGDGEADGLGIVDRVALALRDVLDDNDGEGVIEGSADGATRATGEAGAALLMVNKSRAVPSRATKLPGKIKRTRDTTPTKWAGGTTSQ